MARKIQFEYCECGCHGNTLQAAGRCFWIYQNLDGRDKTFTLHAGHGPLARKIGTYNWFREAEAEVKRQLRLDRVVWQRDLDALDDYLSE